jgi:hypothetical protein
MEPNIYDFFQFLQNKTGHPVPFDLRLKHSTPEQIKQMYNDNPELFEKRRHKKILHQIGVENIPGGDMWFELSMDVSEIGRLVDGDYVVRNYTDSRGVKRKIYFFETLLSGDYWELFDNNSGEWESGLEYYADEENKDIIWDLIKSVTNPDEIEGLSLKDAISEYDRDHEIRNAISNAMTACESDSYYVYTKGILKDCLEEYGDVEQLNDEGVRIRINLEKVIEDTNTDDDELDETFERCGDELQCVFFELLGTYYDKPYYRTDDRWTPDINERDFNDNLNSYLGDVRM